MATPFLYNGQAGVQTDPNGLLNMRARYYSPYLCRFLNADPIGFSGGSNWFAYADGNPISLSDPFGLCASFSNLHRGPAYGEDEPGISDASIDLFNVASIPGLIRSGFQLGAATLRSGLAGYAEGYAGKAIVDVAANGGGRMVQTEFAFARGASIQTPGVTTAGETFVRAGAAPQNLKFGSTSLSGAQPGTYAFPEATFNLIGQSPTALKNFGDLPGAAPQYFRTLSPPAGTPIQRGIVPGGEFGGVGGVQKSFSRKDSSDER